MEWHLDKEIIDFGFTGENTIVIDWSNGRRSVFDPRPYMTGAMEKLLDPDFLETAYVMGHGRGIAWPDNLDFGAQLLYEESVDDEADSPLPLHGPRMRWKPGRLILRLRPAGDGKIAIDWNDGTRRIFNIWDHADNDGIEKFVDRAYSAQARVAPERDAVVWPQGERFDAKTLYERSEIIEA